MERLIFHVDVNSAFLSWEAVRGLAEGKEDIRLIPSAIGGDKSKRTGIILAKSIPAKKYGIKTGEPVSMALQKCPELHLEKPDFRLYEKQSQAFMDILRSYAPVLEKYSIDECFLDFTGTSKIYPDPIALAYEMKDKIRDTLGFTVNIGIGRNKICAKMASDFQKPDRVHTLFPEEIPKKMWPLPVGELFSVGRSSAEKLERAHIKTIGELAETELSVIQRIVGKKAGIQIHAFANGIDDSEVLSEREDAKGYSVSTTLEEDVTESEAAHRLLLELVDSVALRMRMDGVKSYCIGVQIRSNDFKNRSHQKKLLDATDVTDEIYRIAVTLFDELWDGRTPLRLLGVSLTSVTKDACEQISLFRDEKKEKAKKIDRAMDEIRTKFGMDAITRGVSGGGKRIGRKYRAQMENKAEKEKEN